MLRKLFQRTSGTEKAIIAELRKLAKEVEKKNISIVMDDIDAGYDMAIDEVLELIDEAINQLSSKDVDYSGGY